MFRVMLHAMSLYRDAPMMLILKGLLERMGCSVIVSSVRNYVRIMQMWRPHAILYGTLSKTPVYLQYAPHAKLFYCAGEGGESTEFMDENQYLDNWRYYEAASRIFLWGRQTRYNLAENARKRGLLDCENRILNDSKISIVGHPRLDIVRCLEHDSNTTNTVGINTSFCFSNAFTQKSVLWYLLNTLDNIDGIHRELREAAVILNIIDWIMDNTSMAVSIRPYPLENRTTYAHRRLIRHMNRFHMDNSLDYATWLARQRLVISHASTTITEAYLLNIPVILIDRLAGNDRFYSSQSEVKNLYLDVACVPASFEELFDYLLNPSKIPMGIDKIKDFWDIYYGMELPGSVLKRIATAIVADIKQQVHGLAPLVPRVALELYDRYAFMKSCRLEPTHHLFHYCSSYHGIPEHYKQIVDKLWEE